MRQGPAPSEGRPPSVPSEPRFRDKRGVPAGTGTSERCMGFCSKGCRAGVQGRFLLPVRLWGCGGARRPRGSRHTHRLLMASASCPKRSHLVAVIHVGDFMPQWPQAVSGSPSQLCSNCNFPTSHWLVVHQAPRLFFSTWLNTTARAVARVPELWSQNGSVACCKPPRATRTPSSQPAHACSWAPDPEALCWKWQHLGPESPLGSCHFSGPGLDEKQLLK